MAKMTDANAEQSDYWNDRAGRNWVELQKKMDDMLRPFGDAALAAVAPKAGEHVLDIGCGTGTTTMSIAESVGPQGSVMGVDISRTMLAHAQARAAVTPEYNITFKAADAQTEALPPSRFDAVFSRFGVMFFGDPAAAFANIGSAVKPGGRIGFVCWREPRDNPWASEPPKLARPYVELPPRPGPEEPGQFSFADETRVERLLTEGGWTGVTIERFDIEHRYADDLDAAVERAFLFGPHSGAMNEAPQHVQDSFRNDLRALFEPLAAAGEIRYPFSTWVVTARRPETEN